MFSNKRPHLKIMSPEKEVSDGHGSLEQLSTRISQLEKWVKWMTFLLLLIILLLSAVVGLQMSQLTRGTNQSIDRSSSDSSRDEPTKTTPQSVVEAISGASGFARRIRSTRQTVDEWGLGVDSENQKRIIEQTQPENMDDLQNPEKHQLKRNTSDDQAMKQPTVS